MEDLDLPENVTLSKRAAKDLDNQNDKDLRIILDDLFRLAKGTFPGEVKAIKTLPRHPFQADCGRYRILFRKSAVSGRLEVITVFAKKDQRAVFRGLSR